MADSINSLSGFGTSTDIAVNPKSIMGKDDFMKLLLTELQHQDPTSPMDSDKILSQTSQLAQLESQDKTNKALEALTASFANNQNFSAVSSIGKYAKLENTLALTNDTEGKPNAINFELDFAEDVESGTVKIYDENFFLVKTLDIEKADAGKQSFNWDGTNDAGEYVRSGSHTVVASYLNEDGVKLKGEFGSHKIESVKFEGSETFLKLDGTYVSFAHVKEIFEKEEVEIAEEEVAEEEKDEEEETV
jgi:flagellar basal-body rod modification protein FlgD